MATKDDLSRLERLTSILTFLQSKRLLTSAEIAKKFNVSKRTAYRDIKALEKSGIPIHTVEGKGYSLLEGYNLPPVMFSEEEAHALITSHNIILQNRDRSLVEHHTTAIDKVKAILRFGNKEKVEMLTQRVAYMKNYKRENSSNSLVTIQKAITHLSVIDIVYLDAKSNTSQRQVEPQALYHTQENWILIAWCRKRGDYREFRLDRITALKVLDQVFEGRNFVLLEYFQDLIDQYTKKNIG